MCSEQSDYHRVLRRYPEALAVDLLRKMFFRSAIRLPSIQEGYGGRDRD